MTRLNLIDPSHLTKRHLVAEYKEITQFLHIVKKRVEKGHPMDDIPERYTLNGGHCLFFFNKGKYVYNRFIALRNELITRGINVDEDKYRERLDRIATAYNESLFNDYKPTTTDYGVAIERIGSRINQKPDLYPDKDVFFNSIVRYN